MHRLSWYRVRKKREKTRTHLGPNKLSVEDITSLFGLGKDYAYSAQDSSISFRASTLDSGTPVLCKV